MTLTTPCANGLSSILPVVNLVPTYVSVASKHRKPSRRISVASASNRHLSLNAEKYFHRPWKSEKWVWLFRC